MSAQVSDVFQRKCLIRHQGMLYYSYSVRRALELVSSITAVVDHGFVANLNGKELTIRQGDTVTDIVAVEKGWYEGSVGDRRGKFPSDVVTLIMADIPSKVSTIRAVPGSVGRRSAVICGTRHGLSNRELGWGPGRGFFDSKGSLQTRKGGWGQEREVVTNKDTSANRATLEKLECPICTLPMAPPIFQCATGHSFCNECEPKLAKCPICQIKKTNKIRNFALERFTDGVFYPCRSSVCDAFLMLTEKKDHSPECAGRLVKCWESVCNKWEGTVADLWEHIYSAKHMVETVELNEYRDAEYDFSQLDEFAEITATSAYIRCDGRLFRRRLVKRGNSYDFCVMLYGADHDATKYQVTVEVPGELMSATYVSAIRGDLNHTVGYVSLFSKGSAMGTRILTEQDSRIKLSFKIAKRM